MRTQAVAKPENLRRQHTRLLLSVSPTGSPLPLSLPRPDGQTGFPFCLLPFEIIKKASPLLLPAAQTSNSKVVPHAQKTPDPTILSPLSSVRLFPL